MKWLTGLFRRKQRDGGLEQGRYGQIPELLYARGGTSPLAKEADELKWIVANQAQEAALGEPNPELWTGGRMAFPAERSAAFAFEQLRDRVANYAGDLVTKCCAGLNNSAAGVTLHRDKLRGIDQQYEIISDQFASKMEELAHDEIELKRYYRLRNTYSRYLKYAVAFFFVLTEFVISAQVFLKIFPQLELGLEWLLSLGVTLALIVIPHFTALGLKEGMTRYHQPEFDLRNQYRRRVSVRLLRAVSFEEMDDRVFRIASIVVGTLLIAMIFPLSYLRASAETLDGDPFPWEAFLFLLFLQFALSGYFFLREWLNHGPASEALHYIELDMEELSKKREETYSAYQQAIRDYHASVDQLVFVVQQAPRWDSYIVSAYFQSIWQFRAIVTQEHPELAVFIHRAEVPTLAGIVAADPAAGLVVAPVTIEHPSLAQDGPMGRMWWMQEANVSLMTTYGQLLELDDEPSITANGNTPGAQLLSDRENTTWPAFRSPSEFLEDYVFKFGGFSLRYTAPRKPEPAPAEDTTFDLQSIPSDDEGPEGSEAPPPVTVPDATATNGDGGLGPTSEVTVVSGGPDGSTSDDRDPPDANGDGHGA